MSSDAPGFRLRVLMVITRGEPGGAQMHVLDLVRGLRQVLDLYLAVGDDEFLAREVRALGVPVHVVPALQREVAPSRDLTATRALRALVQQLQPHLVHTHSTKAGLLGRLAAALAGVPAVHTAHSWAFSDGIARRRKALAVPTEALAARATDRFIVVSAADRDVALRYRVAPRDRIRVVHNGVADLPQRARPAQAGTPVVVMVARMAPPKDHALLLRALAEVALPWRLRLVGDGPGRPEVDALIDELGVADRVELLGVRGDVAELLASAHVAVLASRQEGFPLVVLEAMRAGLPVVASDVGGVAEAVTEGRSGYLVARDDLAGMRRALGLLLADRELRGRLGAAGRDDYQARFTVERMLSATLAVYGEIARDRALPQPAEGSAGGRP